MFDQIAKNVRRTYVLVAGFVVVVLGIGYVFGRIFGGGPLGLVLAALLATGMTLTSFYAGDRIILAVSRAQEVTPEQEPRLHNLVDGLAIAAGIPKPRVYVVPDLAPNAFATGRDPEHASIAVTTGLLQKMNRVELEGVVAHELAHVKNRDTLVLVVTATLVGIVVLIADWTLRSFFWGRGGNRDREGAAVFALFGLVLALITPIAAAAMQAAISRRRESLADVSGVSFTRYPPGLISALRKLRDDQTAVRTASHATAALWIESPLKREEGISARWNRLFDSHPPLDDRIKALEEL